MTGEQEANGFQKVNPYVPPEGIGLGTLLTSEMGGRGESLFGSATKVTPSLKDGWPLIGGGSLEDRQWVLRVYATRHYWKIGAKPDLDSITFMKWVLTPGVDGKRAEQLINAYAFGTTPAPRGGDPEQGRERRGGLRR